jgi:3-oxoacyl-[acyl-carrier-protein] synthase-1
VFTSSGVRSATAFGSARLNLKFFEELPWRDAAGAPVVGARTPLDLSEISGDDRLATMAARALIECTASPRVGAGESAVGPPAPLLLCLPAPEPDLPRRPAQEMLSAIAAQVGAPIDLPASQAFASGRGAIFDALEEADRLLTSRSAATVYLGGVDSLVDRQVLDRWLRAGRLKTSTTEGVIPGEGAAFLRLGRDGAPGALAAIAGVARAQEPRTRNDGEPNIGAGLAAAARDALAAAVLAPTEVSTFIHDAAGDRFGFREVTLAIARLQARAEPRPLIASTASCAGELGAATGPFALGLAAFFLRHGVTDGPATLVLGTSEGAERGAAVVTHARTARAGR